LFPNKTYFNKVSFKNKNI